MEMSFGFIFKRTRGRCFGAALFFCAAVVLSLSLTLLAGAKEACPARPPCKGCGCKGGPGYRGPDGRCVSFKALTKVCGDPPTTFCVFENAPGTGANRDCALGLSPAPDAEAEGEKAAPAE